MHYFIQINDCPDSDNYKTAGDANLQPFQQPPPCHSHHSRSMTVEEKW